MSRLPRAMLTMAVMWVSGPNTWIGTPSVFPRKAIAAIYIVLLSYLLSCCCGGVVQSFVTFQVIPGTAS